MRDFKARSKWAGSVSELAVLTPISPGRIPGERRTYEQRLRAVLASLSDRAVSGRATPLSKIPTFHFARVLILRPEQYLKHSWLDPAGKPAWPGGGYEEFDPSANAPPTPAPPADTPPTDKAPRSWLFTLVIFDDDPMVYLREIAEFIGPDFDQVFENCENYPFSKDYERFWSWIRFYQIEPEVFYTPYPELSVARIKQLEAFKRNYDAFLAKVRTPDGTRVDRLDELFDEFVRENQAYSSGFPTEGGTYETGE